MLNKTSSKFLLDLVSKKPIYFVISLSLSLISAGLNIVGTALLIPMLIFILGSSQDSLLSSQLPVFGHLFAIFVAFPAEQKISLMLATVFLIIILKNCAAYANILISNRHTKYLASQLKQQGFTWLCKVNLGYYQQNKIGDILFKLNQEIERTALAVKSCHKVIIISTTIFTFVGLLVLISWQLTLLCFISLGLLVIVNRFIYSVSRKSKRRLATASKKYTRRAIELLTGIKLVKAVGGEVEEYQAVKQIINEKDQAQLQTQAISALITPINEIVAVAIVSLLILAARYGSNQSIPSIAPTLLVYLAILLRLLPFVGQLSSTVTQFTSSINSIENTANFLRRENKTILHSGTVSFVKLLDGIQFKNITFAYPYHAKIILDKVNLWIPQGKITAIVGFSGAGKSIIAELLPRFYEPIEGKILIDGINIEEYDAASLRKSISTINQSPFLFNNSLAYNLTYGLKDISQAEIVDVIEQVGLDDFVSQLPEGLATQVGGQLGLLSELHKYKLAIARAILRNPEILILDESNAGVEVLADAQLQAAIDKLCCDRTTVIIAQGLSSVKDAEQIVVLNQGTVIESGTHAELLKQGEFYNRWYSMQFKSSQQSAQQKLAQKIAKKLARQTSGTLSAEIRQNLDSLLSYMQLISEGIFKNDLEEENILDQSYQSAKQMLVSLQEYELKIAQKLDKTDEPTD